jgi:methionyl-tRNA formyltransferase
MSQPIVFFGSGPVAAASLRLLARDFTVEAVVTKPRPAHHKQPFPVLKLAEELGLKVLTAGSTREVSALFEGRPFKSELGVIIDHGILLAADVLNYFPLGIVNSHFSLLPLLKGPDPISFTILNGDTETGVSLMVIAEKLDEGQLIAQERVPVPPGVTTPELTGQLIGVSHGLLVRTLPAYAGGSVKPYPQPDIPATFTRKLVKTDGDIDWSKPAARLEREIRAYAGWPRSRTMLGGTNVIITRAHVSDGSGTPGKTEISGKELRVGTGEGMLVIESLIPAGKREMPAQAFLAGYKL